MENERYVPWNPIPHVPRHLYCEAVHDDIEGVRVLLRGKEPMSPTFRIVFDSVIGYRNINESYRLRTWEGMDLKELPSLLIVENSRWSAWLVEEAGGILRAESLVHYALYTLEDCIDVVTDSPPNVEWLNLDRHHDSP